MMERIILQISNSHQNGFLGSMKYKNPEEPSTGISMNFRRKLGTMAMYGFHEGLSTSLNTVGASMNLSKVLRKIRKNYWSNESM